MKKILTTLILLLWTQVIYAEDSPEKIVNVVANKVFNELKSNPNIVKNNKLLNELVEKELMPFINHKYISLKILRKYIKKNKREDIYYFINNSQPFLIKTFSNALKFYKQQDYIITKNRSSSKKIKKINMIIQNDRNKNITLTFVFKFDKKSTKWKVFDLVAEGVSLLSSKQKEFSPLLRKKGIRGTIDYINSK